MQALSPPAGRIFRGIVLDENETPVHGADVWLASSEHALTRSDGTFEMSSRSYHNFIYARKGEARSRISFCSATELMRLFLQPKTRVILRIVGDRSELEGLVIVTKLGVRWLDVRVGKRDARLSGAAEGPFEVTVSANGYAACQVYGVAEAGDRRIVRTIMLRTSAAASGLVVENDTPVTGACVVIRSSLQGAILAKTLTGADGRWSVNSIPAGVYELDISKDASRSRSRLWVHAGQTHEHLTAIEHTSVALISGTVANEDGSAAAFARVACTSYDGGEYDTRARSDGTFEFRMPSRGALEVHARLDGLSSASALLTTQSANADLVLVLAPSTLTANLKFSDGEFIPGASVTLYGDKWRSPIAGQTTTSDSNGAVAFSEVTQGPYRVVVRLPGCCVALNVNDVVWPGQSATLVLPRPGRLVGTVPYGIEYVVIVVRTRDGIPLDSATATRVNALQFSLDLPPGSYELEICCDGGSSIRVSALVNEGETTELAPVSLEPGGLIAGRVFFESGAVAAGAVVRGGALPTMLSDSLKELMFGYSETIANDDGRFEIELSARHRIVRAFAWGHSSDPTTLREASELALLLRDSGTLAIAAERAGDSVSIIEAERGSQYVIGIGPDGLANAFDIPRGTYEIAAGASSLSGIDVTPRGVTSVSIATSLPSVSLHILCPDKDSDLMKISCSGQPNISPQLIMDGEVVFDGLTPGDYTCCIGSERLASFRLDAEPLVQWLIV